jgi:hypothetical protein
LSIAVQGHQAQAELLAIDEQKRTALAVHHTAEAGARDAAQQAEQLQANCADLHHQKAQMCDAMNEFLQSADDAGADVGTQVQAPVRDAASQGTVRHLANAAVQADIHLNESTQRANARRPLRSPAFQATASELHSAVSEARCGISEPQLNQSCSRDIIWKLRHTLCRHLKT